MHEHMLMTFKSTFQYMCRYLTVGVGMNHRQGAVGSDLVPQKEFWITVLGLAREGCSFSIKRMLGWRVKWGTMQRYESL